MKICNKTPAPAPIEEPIPGRVYRLKKVTSRGNSHSNNILLLAVKNGRVTGSPAFLVMLRTGKFWSDSLGFGSIYKPEDYEDVTDKVCLDTSQLQRKYVC